MTTTQTTVIPKMADGAGCSLAIYRFTFDTTYPTGGEALTVTDFSAVYGAEVIGVTALADNGYAIRPVLASATSLLLSVWWNYNPAGAGSADRVDIEYTNGGDLVAELVGPVNVLVYGV